MKKIIVLTNPQKKEVKSIFPSLVNWLEKKKIEVSVNQTGKENFKKTDLVVVLGGDGTILKAARLVVPFGIPVLGINLGEFGFLSGINVKSLYSTLERILKKDYYIEERILLTAKVIGPLSSNKKNNSKFFFLSLNDIVVKNASSARVIKLKVKLGSKQITQWVGDGLIVATPTGSTAYSLAAFGPIVYPTLPVLIITPICPHLLSFRSLVLPAGELISIQVDSGKNVMLSVDGQEEMNLGYNDIIEIKQAKKKLKLVCLSGNADYFQILNKKLKWGKR
ncbi:NAD(+)/NADH kinase [bacterium]|nr:NAD(+)/NADH kinase [bacterium]